MRKKALLIGALPVRLRGPWVPVMDGRAWRYTPVHDFQRKVKLEVVYGDTPPILNEHVLCARFELDHCMIDFEGTYARILILEDLDLDEPLTIEVTEIEEIGRA